MSHPSTRTSAVRLLLLTCLAFATVAFGQRKDEDDAPAPYDDDSEERALPKKSGKRSERLREEDEDAKARDEETLTHLDDPNLGLGGELLGGVMLFDSSRGAGVDPRFLGGLRFTWEWGRLVADEFLREMFFADVTWMYSATWDGTGTVHAETHQHYFTLAPAVGIPFGKSTVSAYAQLGVGFNVDYSVLHVDANATSLTGTKFLFQYGLGLRGRPALVANGTVRLEFRLELTRFIRGYMHDMFLGAGLGMAF